jgi:hypothetical protein
MAMLLGRLLQAELATIAAWSPMSSVWGHWASGVPIGKHLRWKRSDVDAWLEEHEDDWVRKLGISWGSIEKSRIRRQV